MKEELTKDKAWRFPLMYALCSGLSLRSLNITSTWLAPHSQRLERIRRCSSSEICVNLYRIRLFVDFVDKFDDERYQFDGQLPNVHLLSFQRLRLSLLHSFRLGHILTSNRAQGIKVAQDILLALLLRALFGYLQAGWRRTSDFCKKKSTIMQVSWTSAGMHKRSTGVLSSWRWSSSRVPQLQKQVSE